MVFHRRDFLCPKEASPRQTKRRTPGARTDYVPSAAMTDRQTRPALAIREAAKQIDMAAYVLTDRAVVEALRAAAARGAKVRIWRDASMAEKVGDFDVEVQLGGRVQGLEIRSIGACKPIGSAPCWSDRRGATMSCSSLKQISQVIVQEVS